MNHATLIVAFLVYCTTISHAGHEPYVYQTIDTTYSKPKKSDTNSKSCPADIKSCIYIINSQDSADGEINILIEDEWVKISFTNAVKGEVLYDQCIKTWGGWITVKGTGTAWGSSITVNGQYLKAEFISEFDDTGVVGRFCADNAGTCALTGNSGLEDAPFNCINGDCSLQKRSQNKGRSKQYYTKDSLDYCITITSIESGSAAQVNFHILLGNKFKQHSFTVTTTGDIFDQCFKDFGGVVLVEHISGPAWGFQVRVNDDQLQATEPSNWVDSTTVSTTPTTGAASSICTNDGDSCSLTDNRDFEFSCVNSRICRLDYHIPSY